jgi:hypothetical protein
MAKIIGKQPAGPPAKAQKIPNRWPMDQAQMAREKLVCQERARRREKMDRERKIKQANEMAHKMGAWARGGQAESLASALAGLRSEMARKPDVLALWPATSSRIESIWLRAAAARPKSAVACFKAIAKLGRPSPMVLVKTMLRCAAQAESVEALEYLEKAGVGLENEEWRGAMENACLKDRALAARWLFEKMPVELRAEVGFAGAMMAARQLNRPCVEMLAMLGVDLGAKDARGHTCGQVAQEMAKSYGSALALGLGHWIEGFVAAGAEARLLGEHAAPASAPARPSARL